MSFFARPGMLPSRQSIEVIDRCVVEVIAFYERQAKCTVQSAIRKYL